MVAAVADHQILASIQADHRIDDASLVPHIEALLKEAGWSYPDLTNIACVVGPGGFTSLRVAVALANALSHELKIPSCGIHLSDVYRARDRDREGDRVWFHSTKKNELFIRESEAEPRCITVDDLKKTITKNIQWMGELIPEHRKIVDDVGAAEAALVPLEEILPQFLKKQTYKEQILQPWYGRGW